MDNPISSFMVSRVASALMNTWSELGQVPFPLYDHEADGLAKAAIKAVMRAQYDERETDRHRAAMGRLQSWRLFREV